MNCTQVPVPLTTLKGGDSHFNFRLIDSLHLERGGEGGAVGVLAQGGPVHLGAVDGDFPPLAVLLAQVNPAGAEQRAVHEVFVQRIALVGHPGIVSGTGTWV